MARGDLQVYRVFAFNGGLDVNSSPQKLALLKNQNRLTKATNMVYTTSGAVTKRYDQTKINTTTLGASVGITGGIQFRHSNGTDYLLVGTDDGRLVQLNSDGTTTNIKTGLTTSTRWSFAIYNDKVIACNGADAPRKWNGTTEAALGGSPPSTGRVVVTHGNRVLMTDATAKSTLYWSALNNEENWTAANDAGNTAVAQNDGSNLITLVPSINECILLKGARPYRLQGTSPSTYAITSIVPTTGSVGALSTQGACFAVNDVWWGSEVGVHNLTTTLNFGDFKEKFVSERIQQYFQPNSGLTVTLQNLNVGVLCYDPQWNRIMYAVDTDGDAKNDTLFVYDVDEQAWSVWPNQSIASMWVVRNSTSGVKEIYAGGYDGFVRALNRSVSTNAIDGHARHISTLNGPGIEKSPRHLFLYFSEEGNYSVTGDTKFDFGASGGQTFSASLLGNSHTLGVNWVLGTDPLGAQSHIVKRVDLTGVGEYLEIGIRNQNAGEPFTWQGYEVLWRPRRVIRRAS